MTVWGPTVSHGLSRFQEWKHSPNEQGQMSPHRLERLTEVRDLDPPARDRRPWIRWTEVRVEPAATNAARRWVRPPWNVPDQWTVQPFETASLGSDLRRVFAVGKRVLWLRYQKGAWLRPFAPHSGYGPGRPVWVVDLGEGCPMDCTYCVLQSYLQHPYQVVYVNLDDLDRALAAFRPEEPVVLAAGVYVDSGVILRVLDVWPVLLPWLEHHPAHLLELRTKLAVPDEWLPKRPPANLVFGVSLTPSPWDRLWEIWTDPVEVRLAWLGEVARAGFRVALHFDPLIGAPGWQSAYADLIAALAGVVPRRAVAFISMGSLRFDTALKAIARARFATRAFWTGPFVRAPDGLYRYAWPIRRRMYIWMREQLQRAFPGVAVFYAMEPFAHVLTGEI